MSRDCRKGYKCPSGKICNPASGRCVNVNGTVGKAIRPAAQPVARNEDVNKPCKVQCAANQICNPKTGRCVSSAGVIGKKLISSRQSANPNIAPLVKRKNSNPCDDKKCPSDKICNPKTGKCVMTTGTIGRKITEQSRGSTSAVAKKENESKIQSSVSGAVKYIIGPVSFAHLYSGKYCKNIYLFGDKHVRAVNCPKSASNGIKQNVAQFIADTILANPDKIIDVYLEHAFISDKYPIRPLIADNFLNEVNSSFESCTQIRKSICKYPNVRVHYVNVRKTIPKLKDLNDIWHLSEDIRLGRSEIAIQRKKLALSGVDKLFPIDYYELLSLSKVDKQVDAIKDPCVRQHLEHYVLEELRASIPVLADWEAIRDKTPAQFKQSADKIIRFLNAFMDGYLLARMFRSYTRSREGKSSNDSMFNIIYVGDTHAYNYLKVFRVLGFLQVNKIVESGSEGKDMQCINLGDHFQPFFHQVPTDTGAKRQLEDSFGKMALSAIPKGYNIVSKLGEGVVGQAFLVSDEYFNQQILKFAKVERTVAGNHAGIEHEFAMQTKFAALGLSPKALSLSFYHPQFGRNEEVAVTTMARVYGTVGYLIDNCVLDSELITEIVNQIEEVLKKMCKYGVIHGDFHPWNLGYDFASDGSIKIIPIDLAYSCCIAAKVPCRPDYELIKLLQVLFSVGSEDKSKIARFNCQYMIKPIQELMLEVFGISPQLIASDKQTAHRLYSERHVIYQKGALKQDVDLMNPLRALEFK
jgi:hypothetical protein